MWLGLAVVVLLAPMLVAGRMYANVDLEFHYTNMVQFGAALAEGYWQPRWAGQAREGLGEPSLVYYSPLIYYFGGLLMLIGVSAWMALKTVIAVGLAGAAVAMRRLCLPWMGGAAAGLAGLGVVLCPLVLLLEFSTANVAWMAGLGWGILLFDRCLRWRREDGGWVDPWVAGLLALLTLTHILSSAVVMPVLGLAVVAMGLGYRAWIRLGLSYGAGLAAAGFYFWPAVTATKLINPAGWTGDNPYRVNFTFLLLYRPQEGLWPAVNTYLPALLGLGLGMAAFFLWRRRGGDDRGWRPMVALCAAGLAALVLSTELTLPLWNAVRPLQMLQFPWRFLYVSLIAFYALSAYALDRRWWWAAVPLGISLLAGAGFLAKMYVSGAHAEYTPAFLERRFGMPEYRVAGPGDATGYLRRGGWAAECREAGAECRETGRRSLDRHWRVEASRAVTLRLPVYAYAAWGVRRDGEELPLQADAETGLVAVPLAPGGHEVELYWRGLAAEGAGRWLSLAGVAVIGFAAWRRRSG